MKRNISYKKSILLSIGFLFFGGYLQSQDLVRIKALLEQNELARAKEAADSAAVIYPTAAVLLQKAAVYSAISNNPAAKNLSADARWETFQALQKAVLADREYISNQLKDSKYKLVFDLCNGYTVTGLQFYNSGTEREDKASFSTALSFFKKAAAISQFIYNNNWGKSEVDTLNLFYLSKSAINAEKEEDAVFYSKKIADSKFIYLPFKPAYEIVYQWLLYYYKNRKEAANFFNYLALAKEQFPGDAYFDLAEIDWLREQGQYETLFKKYTALLQANPANKNYRLAYCRDQFTYLWGPAGQSGLVNSKALITGLQQLTTANNQDLVVINAKLLLAKMYINQAQDITKELMLRSTTDPKVTGGYKKRHRDLLLLSNKYLKQIVAGKAPQGEAIRKEAARLLSTNTTGLKTNH